MAIIIKDLYRETKNKYKLKLLAGRNGMNKPVNWIYVSEDYSTSSFLTDNSLIITTGISTKSEDNWLTKFVNGLIEHNACGLIINTGKYITEDGIPSEIIALCDEGNLPLFIMPWDVKIFDITHDYYNRIFEDTRSNDILTSSFITLINENDTAERQHALMVLEDSIYNNKNCAFYTVCLIFSTINFNKLLLIINTTLQKKEYKNEIISHTFAYKNHICLITGSKYSKELQFQFFCDISHHINNIDVNAYCGTGRIVDSVSHIKTSYNDACAASVTAHYKKIHICSYENLGFDKILLDISNKNTLTEYVDKELSPLIAYDKKHNASLLETLNQYFLCNGSIQAIAKVMYCHRNTVNYRMNLIKNLLDYDLTNPLKNHELLSAFRIREYLVRQGYLYLGSDPIKKL